MMGPDDPPEQEGKGREGRSEGEKEGVSPTEEEKSPRVPQTADASRRASKRLSYAQLAREQRIRQAASRATTRREQRPLPLDLPPRRKQSRVQQETREELLDRLLDPELTLAETAKLLEVCPATVRRYADKGVLPHHRTPGNQRRFKLRHVLEYLEKQDRGALEDSGDL